MPNPDGSTEKMKAWARPITDEQWPFPPEEVAPNIYKSGGVFYFADETEGFNGTYYSRGAAEEAILLYARSLDGPPTAEDDVTGYPYPNEGV
jgi:hypothetical protein